MPIIVVFHAFSIGHLSISSQTKNKSYTPQIVQELSVEDYLRYLQYYDKIGIFCIKYPNYLKYPVMMESTF